MTTIELLDWQQNEVFDIFCSKRLNTSNFIIANTLEVYEIDYSLNEDYYYRVELDWETKELSIEYVPGNNCKTDMFKIDRLTDSSWLIIKDKIEKWLDNLLRENNYKTGNKWRKSISLSDYDSVDEDTNANEKFNSKEILLLTECITDLQLRITKLESDFEKITELNDKLEELKKAINISTKGKWKEKLFEILFSKLFDFTITGETKLALLDLVQKSRQWFLNI